MIDHPNPRSPLSLQELKKLGNRHMAEAHQAVADARRVALEAAEMRAETKRLHNRFHGPEDQIS